MMARLFTRGMAMRKTLSAGVLGLAGLVVLAPIELPVGPLMVVLGVPLLLWLLREAV